jgi:hypothetical protein
MTRPFNVQTPVFGNFVNAFTLYHKTPPKNEKYYNTGILPIISCLFADSQWDIGN